MKEKVIDVLTLLLGLAWLGYGLYLMFTGQAYIPHS